MPLITCKNPDKSSEGTWLKTLNAIATDPSGKKSVRSAAILPDKDLVWIRNGQQLGYTFSYDLYDLANYEVLRLNLLGHKELICFKPHFLELAHNAGNKKQLEHEWVFFPQTDNKYLAWNNNADNTCNSSSNAMFLEFFSPEKIKDDQDYINRLFNQGLLSTNHKHQTWMLEGYGLNTYWKTNSYWGDLIAETNKGFPTVVGFYHRGSKWNPTGGHVGMIIDATEDYVEVLDPYGDLLDGYTSNVWNGYRAIYPRNEFEPRWVGKGQGWMRQYRSGSSRGI